MKVFANGPAKSGTHLLVKAVSLMGYEPVRFCLAMEQARKAAIPWRSGQAALLGGAVKLGMEFPTPIHEKLLRQSLRAFPDHCVFNGHSPYTHELANLLRDEGVRVICIHRDVGDIAFSLARFLAKTGHPQFQGVSLQKMLDRVLEGYAVQHIGEPRPEKRNNLAEIATMAREWGQVAKMIAFADLVGPEGGGDRRRQIKALGAIANHVGASDVDLEAIRDSLFGDTETFNGGQIGGWERHATVKQKHRLEKMVSESGVT